MKHKEIEYKYWAGSITKEQFLERVMKAADSLGMKAPESLYIVSCDDYYIRPLVTDSFLRFRKGYGRYELTLKVKESGNVVRTEINLDLTNNHDHSVDRLLVLSGYIKAFQVFKEAWIWSFGECDVSFYTLADGRSVIEVESMGYSSTEEGVSIISKWESALGLCEKDREARSLYEIFSDEFGLPSGIT